MGTVIGFQREDDAVADDLLEKHDLPWGINKEDVIGDYPDVNASRRWPIVEFHPLGKETDVTMTVLPALCTVEDHEGNIICSGVQLPLVLAYALTVHRAQGLTLDAVVLNSRRLWAYGQLYTALSRVRDYCHVRVMPFKRGQVLQCRKVINFYQSAGEYEHIIWNTVDNGPDAH